MKKALFMLLLAVLAMPAAGCLHTRPPGSIHAAVWSDGTWLRDARGRVMIIHGMNVSEVAKHPPYLPFTTTSMSVSQTASVFAGLAHEGFDGVRLIVEWAALEPTPGTFDEGYLDQVQTEVDDCAAAGLWVLLDMHQDVFSKCFCYAGNGVSTACGTTGGIAYDEANQTYSNGAPPWACDLAGYSPGECNCVWALNYMLPQVMQSFQDLWDDAPAPDGTGLQEHYVASWQRIAARFKDDTDVLGYEIMNEPFPGQYPLLTTEFEQKGLAPFYEKVARGIRQVDPVHVITFEPSATLSNTLNDYATGISLTTFPERFADLVFTPHFYALSSNPSGGTQTATIIPSFNTISSVSRYMRTPWLIDEMGTDYNSPGSAEYMVTLLNTFDDYNEGWFDWSYDIAYNLSMSPFYPDGTPRSLLDQGGSPVFHGIDVLSRPYPMLTAGTPMSMSYPITSDPASFSTTTFTYTYREDGIGHGSTEIFLPRTHFPDGFTVTTSDGSVSFDTSTDVLSYTKGPDAVHRISIAPCNAADSNCMGF
ncbi:MAG: cellulase family glycosylhydrolase [Deltaproteobacteria bacterium]|nr:cellulase family glycosylhydrolase [Deltaproteobacteria bacterium]MCL5277395.1 cellulase family glycosylhydrolase [Deltaproteobacteria bacterium]